MQLERQESNTTTEEQTPPRPHKNTYEFNLERGRKVIISSNFDNGNISLIKQVTQLHYRLEAVSDFKSKNNPGRKTWFHFCVSVPKGFKVRFSLQNVTIYEAMYEEHNWPRPVFKDERGSWLPLNTAFLTYREQVGLVFDHTFLSESPVYFALTVPHSYDQNQMYLRELTFRMPEYIQYSDQVITTTKQNLNVHMLRMTHKSEVEIETKPFVLITCRVHPGEVGSTFCLMGIIGFLTRSFSLQAHLLLKMFQFVIFPMVNPDGVFGGNYRMDLQNTNLNRVYNEPSQELQQILAYFSPSVFSMKQAISKLIKDKPKRKFMFHFDLHSHSSLKPAFVYGNAFEDIITQTESNLYTKLLEHNSQIFKYGSCQFTQRHMKMKDKGESMTKQGCARVVFSKLADITYSYTMQTSIFPYQSRETLAPVDHIDFKFDQNSHSDSYSKESISKAFNTKNEMVLDNILLGHGMMVTILDILQKNPYTRIPQLQTTLETYRRQISQSLLQTEERFKLLDTKAYQKAKAIGKNIKEQYKRKYQRGWNYLAQDQKLSKTEWPESVKWFEYLGEQKKNKNERRIKTEGTIELNKMKNDFLYPKNMKKRVFNLEEDILNTDSPTKEKNTLSPRNHINIELPTPSQYNLPEIRNSLERNVFTTHKRVAHSSAKKKQSEEICRPRMRDEIKIQPFNNQYPSTEANEITELTQRQATKNIVLSFIHDEMEKMNNIKKKEHNNMVINHKMGRKNCKNSSKSLKILLDNNRVSSKSNTNHKNLATQTCEDIINRRRAIIEEEKVSNLLLQPLEEPQTEREKEKDKRMSNGSNVIPYTGNTQREPILNKREIAKVKYSELKKKNIIRQEMGGNLRLPELKKFQGSSKALQGLFIDSRMATNQNQT